jgi:hypothetical protein
MRPPTIIFKSMDGYSFRIRYRQVLYVNRFFFVDIAYPKGHYLREHSNKWRKEYMKIKKFPESIPMYYAFGFLTLISERRRLDCFVEKVREYDNYLDER